MALQCLDRFLSLADAVEVETLELLATAAVRDAEDGPEFAAEISERFELPVRVLSGEEEGSLAAEGVVWGAPNATGIIGDLGGGSLELVGVERGRIKYQATLPLGPLRLAELGSGSSKSIRSHIEGQLRELGWLEGLQGENFYAVGGAWRSLAKLHMTWADYPLKIIHGYSLPRRDIKNIAALLANQELDSLNEIAGLAGINPVRLDTLPLAGLVLNRCLSAVKPKQVVFSAFGLREGWLFEQLSPEIRLTDPLIAAVQDYADRQGRYGDRGEALRRFTDPLFPEKRNGEKRLRQAVCHLSDVSWREHPEYRANYALEKVLFRPNLPVEHRDRAFIAFSLYWRYGGGDTPETIAALLAEEAQDRARTLGLGLRLADSIAGGHAAPLAGCRLEFVEGELELRLPSDGSLPSSELVERRLAQLRRFVGQRPHLMAG